MSAAREMTLRIRPATAADKDAIWAILEPVFRAGDTYTIDTDIARDDALSYWTGASHGAYVAVEHDGIVGTYYLRRNQGGGGAHVCNCGYVTARNAQGKGIAQAMLAHSLDTARAAGFRAMQFNFVAATNTRAIALWKRAGFDIVGQLPMAFDHPELGFADALVMYKDLT